MEGEGRGKGGGRDTFKIHKNLALAPIEGGGSRQFSALRARIIKITDLFQSGARPRGRGQKILRAQIHQTQTPSWKNLVSAPAYHHIARYNIQCLMYIVEFMKQYKHDFQNSYFIFHSTCPLGITIFVVFFL